MRERLLKRERVLRHRRTENEIFASYLSERFGAPSFRRNISTNFFVFKTRHRTSFGRINRKGGVLMLTEEYRLWDLWVRVYVKAVGEKKRVRVVVIWGDSGGAAQAQLPKGLPPKAEERLTAQITAVAIREICGKLRKLDEGE